MLYIPLGNRDGCKTLNSGRIGVLARESSDNESPENPPREHNPAQFEETNSGREHNNLLI
jgi:hypothetical protein